MSEQKQNASPKKHIVELKRPITWGEGEGAKTITSIDLSGIDEMTGADVLACRQEAERKSGTPNFYGIADSAYRLEVAARVTGHPAELFLALKHVDFEDVDNRVKVFLAGTDSE